MMVIFSSERVKIGLQIVMFLILVFGYVSRPPLLGFERYLFRVFPLNGKLMFFFVFSLIKLKTLGVWPSVECAIIAGKLYMCK